MNDNEFLSFTPPVRIEVVLVFQIFDKNAFRTLKTYSQRQTDLELNI